VPQMMLFLLRAVALACRGRHELALENIAPLQQQLGALKRAAIAATALHGRPGVLDPHGRHLATLAHGTGAGAAGHRRPMAPKLAPSSMEWCSRCTCDGRPTIGYKIRGLISEMAKVQPIVGRPECSRRTCKLEVDVSQRTVSRLLEPATRVTTVGLCACYAVFYRVHA
jgi:hypothetical protein